MSAKTESVIELTKESLSSKLKENAEWRFKALASIVKLAESESPNPDPHSYFTEEEKVNIFSVGSIWTTDEGASSEFAKNPNLIESTLKIVESPKVVDFLFSYLKSKNQTAEQK